MPLESVGIAGREAHSGRSRTARRARPVLEALEDRSLMTGNLSITGAQLVDASDRPITAPVIGEQVFVDAQWTVSGLSSSDQYTVQFAVDGVALNSSTINGPAGDNVPFHWYLGGWFASPGSHTVVVTVDPAHTVAETTYADNSTTFTFAPVQPTTLPQKLALPISGVPFQSWSVVNYIDVNPLSGQANDYRGGSFVYDGHDGYDLVLPDFARMDAGVPVVAAASGTITQVVDGNFDRQTAFTGDPANEVVEDLGNGWTAEYFHFMRSSITVQVGQTVQAGQLLGLVGSSGDSTAPHLHFDLRHDGDLVETFYEPSTYWVNPLPYQGDVAPSITDLGTTNSDPTGDISERPPSVTVFPSSSGWSVCYWFDIAYLDANAQMDINWYRPDGSLASSTPYTLTSFVDHGSYEFYLSLPASVWAASPGTWQVATVLNGTKIGRTSFQVTNGAGVPTVRVEQGNSDILDDRTTPIDFGTVGQGVAGAALSFTIENIGSAPLTTSGLSLPPGYALAGSFPASIPAGGSASFMVQLASTAVGPQFGQITFRTNDPNAPTFGFNVSGVVSGTPPAGAPQIGLSGPALATGFGAPPNVLDPGATLTDSSPQGFNGGTLTVSMASGGTADDRLSILEQGSGAGQIGFNGSGVFYGATQIGTAAITSGPATLSVSLNSSATTADVQALLDDISYQNVSSSPTTAPRYVRFAAVDGAGLASNFAIETVVNSGMAGPSGPRPAPPTLLPTPTPTGPPPPQPGSPSSTPTSAPSSAAPLPASSPTEASSPKKKPVARRPVHHKHPAPTHHRPRPHGHAKGSAKRVKDRRGADGSRPRHGGS
jgi:hypothetical protein